jgi:hypothetical protein
MVMIDVFIMLDHTSVDDTHIQLKILLPHVPQTENCLFLGEKHKTEFAKIIMSNWDYIITEYDEYSKIDNLHTLDDFVDFVSDFIIIKSVMYNTTNKNNPTIHLVIK